jgi:predicted Zn-dependent protease
VIAKEPGNDVYMLLQLLEQPQGRTLEDAAVNAMRQAGFQRAEGGATRLNGLEAYVGLYEGNMEGLGRVIARVAHVAHNKQIFVFAGIAKREVYDRYDRTFSDSIRSFRPLSREEADDIRPNIIDLYVVRQGDSWQSIAQRVSRETVRAATLAIMNDSSVNEPPPAGRLIKVVVPG